MPSGSTASSEGREVVRRGAAALGVRQPVVQAGMGGVAGPRLAAAVSQAGGLGTVALYKSDAAQAEAAVRATAALTEGTFGVNVIPEVAGDLLEVQVQAAFGAADRPLVLNSYGLPPRRLVERLHRAGHRVLVQVGSVADTLAATDLGADVVALQGIEAGGHLLGDQPLADLLAAVCAAGPTVPLLVAGGIHDGAQVREWLSRGAAGVLCGTAFVVAAESAAHPDYKAAVVAAAAGDTVITDRFSIGWPGRRHRVLRSPVTDSPHPPSGRFIAWTTVMGGRRPIPCGSAAVATEETDGRVDHMARYAGVGSHAVTAVEPAATIVARLAPFAVAAAASDHVVEPSRAPLGEPGDL